MRRIRGLVKAVVAIAGAISLHSPMVGISSTGSHQALSTQANGEPAQVSGKVGDLKFTRSAEGDGKAAVTDSFSGSLRQG